MNNRLLEIRADQKQFKTDKEILDDSISDLMMEMGNKVMIYVGESFLEVTEEFATECKHLITSQFLFSFFKHKQKQILE